MNVTEEMIKQAKKAGVVLARHWGNEIVHIWDGANKITLCNDKAWGDSWDTRVKTKHTMCTWCWAEFLKK